MADEIKKSEITKILTELLKVIKVVSVYPEDNPLPLKLKESFSGRFADMTRESGPLVFGINRNSIEYARAEGRQKPQRVAAHEYRQGFHHLNFHSTGPACSASTHRG